MDASDMSRLAAGEVVTIDTPASIANLGPGFDVLGVAVQLYLHLKVRRREGRNEVHYNFIGRQLRGANFIERAFRFLARQHNLDFASMDVDVIADIPMSSGLGSSAAATVAGLRLYELAAGPLPQQALLNAATALEGHPDNVAAAIMGGLCVCCSLPDGSVYAGGFPWPEEIRFIVVTPDVPLPTSAARKVVPKVIPRADAVFNLQRIALMFQSLQSRNYGLLRQALADRIHQPYRQKLVPGLEACLHLEHQDLLGVCLSGAGPSVAALAKDNVDEIVHLLDGVYKKLGVGYVIRTLKVQPPVVIGDEALKVLPAL